jgi:hypothetical protein
VNINREPVEYLLLMWFTNTWDQNSQMIRPNVGLWVSDIEKKMRGLNITISNLFLPMHMFQSNCGCGFLMYFDGSSDGSRKKVNFDMTSKTPDKPCQGTEEELQPESRIQNYPPLMFQCMLWLRL